MYTSIYLGSHQLQRAEFGGVAGQRVRVLLAVLDPRLLELEGCGARAFGEGPAAPVLEVGVWGLGGVPPTPFFFFSITLKPRVE